MAVVVKNPATRAGDARCVGFILGSGRSPGVGNGNPLRYSCLKNSMDGATLGGYQSMGSQRVGHDWAGSTKLNWHKFQLYCYNFIMLS